MAIAKTPSKTPAKPLAAGKPKAAPKSSTKPAAAKAPAKRVAAPKPLPLKDETATFTAQAKEAFGNAGAKARKAANTGKDTATGAMNTVASMVEDVAKTIDAQVGPQYGDYARRAASAVSSVATSLESKDVDQLLDDAREFVKARPGVAIGAAAAFGFLLTRLVKAGDDDEA